MAKRNYTRELRKAYDDGAKIVCSVGPHDGSLVVHEPRTKTDAQPWRLARTEVAYRFSGRECHAVFPLKPADGEEGPAYLRELLSL